MATSGEILAKVRRRLGDITGTLATKGWKDEEILNDYANETVRYMCRKVRRLIRDESTIGEVLATGTITLAGASGSIASVKVNGITVTSGAVPFNGTINQTATDLAANITAYTSTPNYTATASGAVVTISAVAGTGSNPNDYVILVTATTITSTVTVFSGGTSLAEMYLITNKAVYDKHVKILEISNITITNADGDTWDIENMSETDVARNNSDWRTTTGTPSCYIEYLDHIRFYPMPSEAFTASLTTYRLPLTALSKDLPDASPEIHEMFHDDIIYGILQRCFEKDEEGSLRPEDAMKYENLFEKKVAKILGEIIMLEDSSMTVGYN